jgi:sucrose-6F-phosphate phosphohydrolase
VKAQKDRLQNERNALASDLDGTLIPLPDTAQNEEDLIRLNKLREIHDFILIFATGRSFQSVLHAIEQHKLPIPDWIICNVGTSIYEKTGDSFSERFAYHEKLSEICSGMDRRKVEATLKHLSKLKLQPEENQSDFKISYWCEEDDLHDLVDQINKIQQQESLPYSCLGSIDPFNKHGLIDVLPNGVNKAYALDWLGHLLGLKPDKIVYAGDSGNDLAALVGGYASVLVGNATERLRSEVRELAKEQKNSGLCYFAKNVATSGVLEGMRHFKLAPEST